MAYEIEEPPWCVKLTGTFWDCGIECSPLNPPARASRVVRLGLFCFVGEALHHSRDEWVVITPRVWSRWAAKRWLRFYKL